MSDKERIEAIHRHSGLTWRELATRVGLTTAQTFTDIRNGKHCISKSLANKILDKFPELNRDWLMFGDGDMINTNNGGKKIPYYDAETIGGFNNKLANMEDGKQIGFISVGSCFRSPEVAIRHIGESMVEYPDGCILVLRQVYDRSLLVPGHNYVVETREFRVTKRIQKGHSPEYISLYSSNEEHYADGRLVYEPFEVPVESITRIFAVIGFLYSQSPEYFGAVE